MIRLASSQSRDPFPRSPWARSAFERAQGRRRSGSRAPNRVREHHCGRLADRRRFETSERPATFETSSESVWLHEPERPSTREQKLRFAKIPQSRSSLDSSSTNERKPMQTYAILRRSGWRSPGDLQQAAGRSMRVGDEEMSDDIRWIRSYVLEEGGGSVGTVCIYEATSPEAIREHAEPRRPAGRRDHPDRRHGGRPPGPRRSRVSSQPGTTWGLTRNPGSDP